MRRRARRVGSALCVGAALLTPTCLPNERPVAINATCDQDECQCDPGYGNCDADPSNGCETELRFDPEHCGRCGHDCFAGSCNAGRCTAYPLTPPLLNVSGLVGLGDDVYLCEPAAGAMFRVSQRDGQLTLLSTDQNCVKNVAIGSDRLYWSTIAQGEYLDFLWSANTDGSDLTLEASDGWIRALAVWEDRVLWFGQGEDPTDQRIMMIEGRHQDPLVVYEVPPSEEIRAIAMSPTGPYWAASRSGPLFNTSRVLRGAVGQQPELLALLNGYAVGALVVIGDDVYWVEQAWATGDVAAPATPYRVVSAPMSGGDSVVLWSDARPITTLVADGADLYWNAGGDLLLRRGVSGEVEVVVEHQEIDELAICNRALVWHEYPGKLMAVAK